MNNRVRVMIFGGAGYIGSTLINWLMNLSDYEVICVDNLRRGGEALLPFFIRKDFTFIKEDVRNHQAIERIVKEYSPDVIINLASLVGDPICNQFPEEALQVNNIAACQLYDSAIESGVGRFIYASTCSVYGCSPSLIDEDSKKNPLSLYAVTKSDTEEHILRSQSDMTTIILRFATAFGLSSNMRFDLLINEFTRTIFFGRKLLIFDEEQWRPYCHTMDLAKAITLMISFESGERKRIFNVGSTKENYTKISIVNSILHQVGNKKAEIKYRLSDGHDQRNYRVNFDLIHSLTGFIPSMTAGDGIKEILMALEQGIFLNVEERI